MTKKPGRSAADEAANQRAVEQAPIDARLTLALAQASIAAYADFEGKPIVPPADYKFLHRWTGCAGGTLECSEERFGLLFASTAPGQEKTLLFAFRGTDSDLDVWDDLFFETTPFKPCLGKVSPTPCVASGFYSIYDAKCGSMTQSMRQQLFSFLDQYEPKRIYLTGHSLGAALSQLFTLDVAVSAPGIWAANLNFASPMVGTEAWKEAYDSQASQKDPERETVRVINYWDYVPTLPPSLFGYAHVGREFQTAFRVLCAWCPNFLARHSMLNLQTVLQHAVVRHPQVWCGTFQGATGQLMTSEAPPGVAQPAWGDKMRELQQYEQSLREGTAAR